MGDSDPGVPTDPPPARSALPAVLSKGIDVRIALGCIAAIAVLVRLLHVATLDTIPFSDMAIQVQMANERLTLAHLFSPEGFCWLAPGYAVFLKPFFLLASPPTAFLLVRIAQALLGAGTCLLLYRLAARLHSRVAGLAAALLGCFYPHFVFYTSAWLGENLCIPLYLATLLLILRIRRGGSWRPYRTGLVAGAAALVAPATLTLAPVAVAAAARRASGRRRVVAPALVLAGLATLLLPWAVRNRIAYGGTVLIAPDLPLRLLVSPQEAPDLPPDLPSRSPGEIRDISHRSLESFSAQVLNDPIGALTRISKGRWRDLWELRPPWPLDTANPQLYLGEIFFPWVPWQIVMGTGLVGIGVLLVRGRRGSWLLPSAMGAWIAWSLLFTASTRLRLPLESLFLVASGAAVAELAGRLRAGRAPAPRLAALIVTLALLALTGQAGCQAARVRTALADPGCLIARDGQFPLVSRFSPRTLFGREEIPIDRRRGRYLRLGFRIFRQGPERRTPSDGVVWIEYLASNGRPLTWMLQSSYRLDALPADRWTDVVLKSHVPPGSVACRVYMTADPSSPDSVIVDRASLRYERGNDLLLEFLFPYLRRHE